MLLKMYLYICSFDDCIFCKGYCMIIMLCFHIQMSINRDCFLKKSLHLHYHDMHWNSIESAQAGFCAYIYILKKKLLKGKVVLLFTAF